MRITVCLECLHLQRKESKFVRAASKISWCTVRIVHTIRDVACTVRGAHYTRCGVHCTRCTLYVACTVRTLYAHCTRCARYVSREHACMRTRWNITDATNWHINVTKINYTSSFQPMSQLGNIVLFSSVWFTDSQQEKNERYFLLFSEWLIILSVDTPYKFIVSHSPFFRVHFRI